MYLTRSPEGVWYYQRWMPKRFRDADTSLRAVLRVSLRTKNKRRATQLAHLISVKIDKLIQDHFDSAEDFSRAMGLLYQSIAALSSSSSFDDYEEDFLADLDDLDVWLLTKGERFSKAVEAEFGRLYKEVASLRAALIEGKIVSTPSEQDALVKKLDALINPPLPDDQNPTLDELFAEWQKANRPNIVQSSFENSFVPAIDLFVRFVEDLGGSGIRVNKIGPEHIRHYQTHFKSIPKGTIPSRHTIAELIKLRGTPKSPKTIQDAYSNVGTFLNWIAAKGYPINANLQKVLIKGSDVRQNDKQRKQRVPFSDGELKKLFNSDHYTKTGKLKTSAMYWAPLIALFTGARMSEILQLERHDIMQVEGTWMINFDDVDFQTKDDRKHVKKDGSRRMVPVHKQLLELGFIRYCETRKERLFPDEPRNSLGKFDAFQKRHTTYRRGVGVKPKHNMQLLDFHSFRHTVRTRLSELRTTGRATERFDEGMIDMLIGHASKDRSVGQSVYNHAQLIKAKQKALNRITYPSIDFGALLDWTKCEFARKPYRENATKRLKESG